MISQASLQQPLNGNDIFWMHQALSLAQTAFQKNEVPVGAILIKENQVLGKGWNASIHLCDPTAHAEITALRDAGQTIQNYRLVNTTLYVTLEPCVMCAAALVHARIHRLVFGAYDPKAGGIMSKANILDHRFLNHKVIYQGGVLSENCKAILSRFFQEKRIKK